VFQALEACSEFLVKFGGHKYAAGLTLQKKNLQAFIDRFEEVVSNSIDDQLLIPQLKLEMQLPIDKIDFKFFNIMKQMAPFGPQNLAPMFGTENAVVDEPIHLIKDCHIKGSVRNMDSTKRMDFIGFNMPEKATFIKVGEPFQMAFHIEENDFQGNRSLVLQAKDIQKQD
ncbi:MAG: single-stranded-DNA-specific exonuclease RecJ, partial [Bacteroidota bacterium]